MANKNVIPFVGGEWHGEGHHTYSRMPEKILENVGQPPRYIGNNQYDAYVSHTLHEPYYLKEYEGKWYYVAASWIEHWPLNIDTAYETKNAKKIREEKERDQKRALTDLTEKAKIALFLCVIEKHKYLDNNASPEGLNLREPQNYFETERKLWSNYIQAVTKNNLYSGEPPMTKKRLEGKPVNPPLPKS